MRTETARGMRERQTWLRTPLLHVRSRHCLALRDGVLDRSCRKLNGNGDVARRDGSCVWSPYMTRHWHPWLGIAKGSSALLTCPQTDGICDDRVREASFTVKLDESPTATEADSRIAGRGITIDGANASFSTRRKGLEGPQMLPACVQQKRHPAPRVSDHVAGAHLRLGQTSELQSQPLHQPQGTR